jgi:hypothetical protein
MTAQAVVDAVSNTGVEHHLAILSRKRKSQLFGAQYLHAPIPGITPMDAVQVHYTLQGDADDYKRKVYGALWDGTVSPEDLSEEHLAWDIRATYDILWDRFQDQIQDVEVDGLGLKRVLDDGADLVISTIPRPALCHMGHAFGVTEVWAAGDAPSQGINIGRTYRCPEGHVFCNGEDNPAWYRMSRVFGHTTVEWPGALRNVPVSTAARVRKPTKHDCNCWDDAPVLFSGRYGEWSKGVLSHESYFNTYNKLGGK